ncbi:cation efflux family-domain-containing protein [Chytriomyces sp. MP71]|nr:cation efflux family-domain-containing protein [Chytriomyces sp. MP71]
MIHIMGDLLGSVSILVASLTLMFRPSWTIVDPLCTLLFAVIIFGASVGLVKQYFMILMETTPDNISVETVKSHLLGTRGVVAVSSLRLWSLTSGKDACLVVVAVSRRHSSLSGRRISLGHVIASSEDVTLFAGAEEEMELMEVATLGSDSGMPSSMAHADLPGGEVEWSREEYEAVLNGIRESLLRGFGFVELFVEVHLV